MLIPVIQLFALYVFFHGHYSPGGGFQAGTLIAASIFLDILVGDPSKPKSQLIHREFQMAAIGLGVFFGIGMLALIWNGFYLDYGAIRVLAEDSAYRRYLGILIAEAGVFIVVAMTLVVIFNVLAPLLNGEDEHP